MTSFDRRLNQMKGPASKGPMAAPEGSVATQNGASSLGWQAAERVSHLSDVAAGTVIRVEVSGPDDVSSLEVRWDDEGVPLIHELGTPTLGNLPVRGR